MALVGVRPASASEVGFHLPAFFAAVLVVANKGDSFDSLVRAERVVLVPETRHEFLIAALLFRPIVTSTELLLRPIVLPRFQRKEWQSQFLRHRGSKRIMNSADQFETIVCEHYEPLFRFAMSLTRVESDARDLTQQTFYVWATKGHQLRDISKVKTWLFTTLHRTFLAARRRQIRFPHHDLEEVVEQLPVLSPEPANQADCSQVLSALAKVDEVYQAAVALFYLEDCPYKDIAAILEVPIGTVKSRIARGIVQLREILLPDDSRESSLNRDGIYSNANTDEPVAPPANTLPPPRRHAQLAARAADRAYEEWDLSATRFREQPGTL